MAKTATLLILGGTAEAASLAEATFERLPGLRVVTSLAGRTRASPPRNPAPRGAQAPSACLRAV